MNTKRRTESKGITWRLACEGCRISRVTIDPTPKKHADNDTLTDRDKEP